MGFDIEALSKMNRYNYIDAAKALAISSVVLGHVLEAQVLDGAGGFTEFAYQAIYLVHMPFFFLVSGYLFSGHKPVKSYFVKKFLHLMLPYFAWLLVFNLKAIAGFSANLLRGGLDEEKLAFYLQHFGDQLWGGLAVSGAQMILWFPPCLFVTQQVANWLIGHYSSRRTQLLFVVAVCGLGYVNQYSVPKFHLPLALNVVAGALPFFMIGHWLRDFEQRAIKVVVIGVLLLALMLIGLTQISSIGYHMRMASYGLPFISTVAAIGGFYFVRFAATRLTALPKLGCWLLPIGNASMTIMYIHVVCLNQLKLKGAGADSIIMLTVGGVAVPVLVHQLLYRIPLLRLGLLGEMKVRT